MKRWIRALLVVALSLVLTAWSYLGPPIHDQLGSLPRAAGDKVVALSFDDGPNPPYTEQILEVLAAEGVRATFFMTGEHVSRYPETARRVLAAGHAAGNHGWDAEHFASMSPARIRDALARTDDALRGIGVRGEIPVRAAGLAVGYPGAWVLRTAGRLHVGGSVAGSDWTSEPAAPSRCRWFLPQAWCPSQDAERIAERVLSQVSPGAIIVLHDAHDRYDAADRSGTVEATRRIVRALRTAGYRFVGIGERGAP